MFRKIDNFTLMIIKKFWKIRNDEDESGPIPYQIGDTFVMHNLEEIGNLLTDEKRKTQSRILNLESKLTDAEKVLTQLKADLYGKFGNEINLEADDE